MRQAYDYWQDQPGNYFLMHKHPETFAQHRYSRFTTLSTVGVRYKASIMPLCESLHSQRPRSNRSRTSRTKTSERNTLYPVLTSFGLALLVPVELGSLSTMKTTSDRSCLKGKHSHGVSPIGYLLSGLAIGKQSTSLFITDISHIRTMSDTNVSQHLL